MTLPQSPPPMPVAPALAELDLLLADALALRIRLGLLMRPGRRPGWPIRRLAATGPAAERASQPCGEASASIWSRQISML